MHHSVNHPSPRQLSADDARIQWDSGPSLCSQRVEVHGGSIEVRRGRFRGGAAEGVEVIRLDTGPAQLMVLPTRGMGVWRLHCQGVPFGWQSPVRGPVHPTLVPVWDPSGLGWLEGFDELLVRCGLESNGAPEFDANGRLRYPLHGRVANLPAGRLTVEIDADAGLLSLTGEVIESRLFFQHLRLQSRITVRAGSNDVEIEDRVSNDASRPATAQLLYHINVGPPVLGEGAEVLATVDDLQPKDRVSAAERDRWSIIGPPESGYVERVYFARPRPAAGEKRARAMLRSADQSSGLGVSFDCEALPHFVLWKNTAAIEDGYVVGMEPATNLPNRRSDEASAGRVVRLAAGETATFRVGLHPRVGREQVAAWASGVRL